MEDAPMKLVRFRDPNEALGLAVRLLAGEAPFRDLPLGASAGAVVSAIDDGSYAFVSRQEQAVAVACWRRTSLEQGEAWLRGAPLNLDAPSQAEPAALILAVQAIDAAAAGYLMRRLRDGELSDCLVVYYLRDYAGLRPKRRVRLVRPAARGGARLGSPPRA